MGIQEIVSYLKIIRKWWWAIVLLFTVTVGTMLVSAYLAETQYQATVTVQVSASPPQEVPLYSQFGRQALRDEIEQTRASFNEFLMEGDAPYQALKTLPDILMGGSELRSRTTVDIPENSQLLHIRVRATEAETAALLANTLVETGLQRYGQLLAQPTANTRRFIDQELEVVREELAIAEAALIQFQIDNKTGNLDNAISNQHELIKSLQIQGDLARADGNTTRAQAIEDLILEREAELQNMVALSAEYAKLIDDVERVRATTNYLLDRRSEAQIKQSQILELDFIQIITPARPPRRPISAVNIRLMVLGGIVSILAGALLAFLLEYLTLTGVLRVFQTRPEGSEIATMADSAGEQARVQ